MKRNDLLDLGVPAEHHAAAFAGIRSMAARDVLPSVMKLTLAAVVESPASFLDHPDLAALAEVLDRPALPAPPPWRERATPADCAWWTPDGVEPEAVQQMRNALRLPITVAGALMPDAHRGFGVPIGGVVATEAAVIPFAVGVDIGCRVSLSIFELPGLPDEPERAFEAGPIRDRLLAALRSETRFGKGATFTAADRRHHEILDDPDWSASPAIARLRDRAWYQLGSSGGGNHFVDFGVLDTSGFTTSLFARGEAWIGRYLAIMSHSGSRGPGKAVADYYEGVARRQHPELPAELQELAWLSMDDAEGQAYWTAMNLMGRYAAANHQVIHRSVVEALGGEVLLTVENHHNFAWLEEHAGRELVVHRKGATPAGAGVLGVIPGTMVDPAFVVSGKGEWTSLRSASHGAGRAMSPTQVRATVPQWDIERLLQLRGVELIEGDMGEAPQGYKDIRKVMAAQHALVNVLGEFRPRIVRMAPKFERHGGRW